MAFYLYKHISYAIFPSRIGDIKYYTFLVQIMNNEIIKESKIFEIFCLVPSRQNWNQPVLGSLQYFILNITTSEYDILELHGFVFYVQHAVIKCCITLVENILRRRNQKFVKVDDAPWMKHGF